MLKCFFFKQRLNHSKPEKGWQSKHFVVFFLSTQQKDTQHHKKQVLPKEEQSHCLEHQEGWMVKQVLKTNQFQEKCSNNTNGMLLGVLFGSVKALHNPFGKKKNTMTKTIIPDGFCKLMLYFVKRRSQEDLTYPSTNIIVCEDCCPKSKKTLCCRFHRNGYFLQIKTSNTKHIHDAFNVLQVCPDRIKRFNNRPKQRQPKWNFCDCCYYSFEQREKSSSKSRGVCVSFSH